MILLPHNCRCSNFIVNPKNWEKCKTIKGNWRIDYRFYDPAFKGTKNWGKQIPIRGMNDLKDINERREATKALIEEEMYMLRVEGYNPITKKFNGPNVQIEYEIDPNTLFVPAINSVYEKLKVSKKTMDEIKSAKKYFLKSLVQLKYDNLRIQDVKRRHVRAILDNQSRMNAYSNNRFNSIRSYISILFKELMELEAIEHNPLAGISKRKTIKKIREVLTNDELENVKSHLKVNYYGFYRYTVIFYYSGSRSTELLALQKKDVDLKNQTFKVLVKKGRVYTEELRAININCLHLWDEVCGSAKKNDYLFSKRLVPGEQKIHDSQINRRWKRLVKDKLGITADFYALKHLHTTRTIEAHGERIAASVNGHRSTKMNELHYDVNRKARMLEEAKSLDIQF